MKTFKIVGSFVLIGWVAFSFNSCKKDSLEIPPTVTTSAVAAITKTSATSGGDVTSDGGTDVTERGICLGTASNPTTGNGKVANGTGKGAFTADVIGLNAGTTYFLRAYATNRVGTAYGNEVSFTTVHPDDLATITTTTISLITATTATGGGNVTNDGGAAVTERGICFSLKSTPTISDTKVTNGAGKGVFTADITGLTAGTSYFVRAYAINSVNVAYGTEVTFTTASVLSTLTTAAVTSVTPTTATGGGNIIADGGAAVTERGICYGTASNPTIANNKVINGSGKGTFAIDLTGLAAGTTYFLRAYATSSVGTAYGNEVTFTTGAPSIYAVGGRSLGGGQATITYWKNGVATDVFTGTGNINGNAIAVSGNDVYVAGSDGSNFKYWKNGAASTLPFTKGGVDDSFVTGIAISGTDVYVSGTESGPAWSYVNVAKYWKNGVGINLTDGSHTAGANAIAVVGADVYVTGYESNGTNFMAKYWKNGVAVNLGDGVNYSEGRGLAVVGNDVYVCGIVLLGGVYNAVYWKNGTLVKLTNGLKLAVTQDVVVTKAGDIFVAGHEGNASNYGVVKVWKNGVATAITDGVYDQYAVGLLIISGDVYVASRRSGAPEIWRNGVLMPPPFNGTGSTFYISDIAAEN